MAHRRGGKTIDSVHWTYGSFQFIGQGAGAAAINVFSAQHLPETLLRSRGNWSTAISAAQAAGRGISVAIGMIQVPEGTGSTVLWSPITDGDAPWIWWDVMELLYTEQVVDVIASQNTLSGMRVLDTKAMRKLRNTELQVVVEQATITGLGGANVDVAGSMRVLTGS